MRRSASCILLLLCTVMRVSGAEPAARAGLIPLADGWKIQTSAKVPEKAESVSTTRFSPRDWYTATIPSTVLAALVENKVYPDPYFGMNLRSIPGTGYAIGRNFANLAMPSDSPFRDSWWYRKQFQFANRDSRQVWLHFDGINYRANIWLNGQLVADASQVAGAYRIYDFDITPWSRRPEPTRLRWKSSRHRRTTSPSNGWTGIPLLRTRTWESGATCTLRPMGRSHCDFRR